MGQVHEGSRKSTLLVSFANKIHEFSRLLWFVSSVVETVIPFHARVEPFLVKILNQNYAYPIVPEWLHTYNFCMVQKYVLLGGQIFYPTTPTSLSSFLN